jgi:hypothetical protein
MRTPSTAVDLPGFSWKAAHRNAICSKWGQASNSFPKNTDAQRDFAGLGVKIIAELKQCPRSSYAKFSRSAWAKCNCEMLS